jgi:hypothetical protein
MSEHDPGKRPTGPDKRSAANDQQHRTDETVPEKPVSSEELRWRASGGTSGTPPLARIMAERRAAASDVMRRMEIMRKVGSAATIGPPSSVPKTSGSALPGDVRAKMEPALGADLSAARIHTGSASAHAAAGFGARAFTTGTDVHFGAGEYRPGTKEGDKLIAHELTHVVQGQKSGVQRKAEDSSDGAADAKDGDGTGTKVSTPDQPAEKEADAVGDQVAQTLHGGEKKDDEEAVDQKTGELGKEKAPNIGAKLEPGIIPLAKNGPPTPSGAPAGGKKDLFAEAQKRAKDPKVAAARSKAAPAAAQLQAALGADQQGRVTMGAGINASGQLVIGTSEDAGYLRPPVKKLFQQGFGGALLATGKGKHAEDNIMAMGGLVAVAAGRPICEDCERVIVNGEAIPASPCKSGRVY